MFQLFSLITGIDDNDHGAIAMARVMDMAKVHDFSIDYAKTTRDCSCIECGRRFTKNAMRIMRVAHATNQSSDQNQNNKTHLGQAIWYHVDCFVLRRSEICWLCSGDSLPGFKRLNPKDKEIIQNKIS